MFQRLVVGFAFLGALLFAQSLLAQCSHGGGQGGGRGGMQGGGVGGQIGAPVFAMQNPMLTQMAMQQSVEMQRLWLQQKYVEAVIETREKQRKLAIRSERAAKNRQQTAERREQNRAKLAGESGGAKNSLLAAGR
jgi:hypothetical protein